ncbi:hypothetical protein ACGFJ5_23520 [Micromonospora echinaurantiaca]|uniref:hypothetical protein n=1 Tax=Micromonospora echinaurantiaca TaxID=47857 RepID=UPI00371AFE57
MGWNLVQWLGPAVITAAVGIAALLVNRSQALGLAAERSEHESRLAKEQRVHQQRASAYVEVLTIAERVGQWVSLTKPAIDFGSPPPPALPDFLDQARSQALLNAYASTAVKTKFKEWRSTVDEVIRAVEQIEFLTENPEPGVSRARVWADLETKFRPKEREARKLLADQMADELANERIL